VIKEGSRAQKECQGNEMVTITSGEKQSDKENAAGMPKKKKNNVI